MARDQMRGEAARLLRSFAEEPQHGKLRLLKDEVEYGWGRPRPLPLLWFVPLCAGGLAVLLSLMTLCVVECWRRILAG